MLGEVIQGLRAAEQPHVLTWLCQCGTCKRLFIGCPDSGETLIAQQGVNLCTLRAQLLGQPGATPRFLTVATTDDADTLVLPIEGGEAWPE